MTTRSFEDFGEAEVDILAADPARMAYIKKIGVDEARAAGAIPSNIRLPKGVQLYAIHAADGTRLAIMDNWAAAYGAALENELVPVSVH